MQNLLKAILIKTGLELSLIMVAVGLAAYAHLNPPIRGAIDLVEAGRITGWAYDPREPNAQLAVQLFVDGKFLATTVANSMRPDLVQAGAADTPPHGFDFILPPLPNGKHEIHVYAVRAGASQNQALLSLSKKSHYLEIR